MLDVVVVVVIVILIVPYFSCATTNIYKVAASWMDCGKYCCNRKMDTAADGRTVRWSDCLSLLLLLWASKLSTKILWQRLNHNCMCVCVCMNYWVAERKSNYADGRQAINCTQVWRERMRKRKAHEVFALIYIYICRYVSQYI